MSQISEPTFKLDKYSDEFLKRIFEDVYKIPSEEKTCVVYTFVDNFGIRHFRTYTLEFFKTTVDDFTESYRPTLISYIIVMF